MTHEEMFKKLGILLGKTDMQVKQTGYIQLLHELVEQIENYVDLQLIEQREMLFNDKETLS